MRWQGRRVSTNVNDRRGSGGLIAGGGLGAVVIGIILYLFNGDSSQLTQSIGGEPMSPSEQAAQDTLVQFVGVVLAETEDVWNKIFSDMGQDYTEPELIIFNRSVQSACGFAQSAMGPFYCPGDRQVYIDLSFYDDLRTRFGGGGDFAMAYVVAHEVGHHVQNLLGTTAQMDQMRQSLSEKEYNKLSVKLELQADFYAGVWAHYVESMHDLIEAGDIQEAMNAANAIGDDRLQQQSQGRVVPDAFTHGTSAQRMYWFKKGYTTGDIRQGDTFSDPGLSYIPSGN